MNTFLFSNTPTVTVSDNRGLPVRNVVYHRHPDTPQVTDTRITYHRHDARGFLAQSTDPRLHEAGLVNFTYLTSLVGEVLRTQSVDAGTSLALSDVAGRPCLTLHNLSPDKHDPPVTRTWQYEDTSLPGRLLCVTEQVAGAPARIIERFVWAGPTPEAQAQNLAGQCIRHYDTAGRVRTERMALTDVPQSVTRQLLKDAANPDTVVDWQGEDDAGLEPDAHTTLTTTDATGAVLSTQDAAGHRQRLSYDVAGQLAGSWLTLKGGTEQVIVKSLSYSAAGQKLREEHGNGVVTTYTYEPDTQRLSAIKTERQGSRAKVLQDLRYAYDPVGNVVSVRNDAEATRFWRNQKVVPENTYGYDSLYQLVSATGREMADPGTYTQYTRTYGYDSAGNLTRIRHSAPASGNSYTTDITVSERSNRAVLSTLAKDPTEVEALFHASGQQRLLLPGQSLAWTPRGELHQVCPVTREGDLSDHESYRYDRESQRVLKSSVQQASSSVQRQRVLYLPGLEQRCTATGDKVIEDLQVITLGKAGRAQVRVLHWTAGKPADIANDQLRYSYDNLLGSSALEVDGAGKLISQEEFYPFGGTAVWTHRHAVEASYKTVRYSGKERDATGLYYYGYRYYQSWAGRWLSADPAGTVDGLNLYCMVRNNPVSRLDDQGLADRDPNEDDDGFVLPKGRKQRNQQSKQGMDGKTGAAAGGSRAEPNYALKDSASTGLRKWVESRSGLAKNGPTEAFGRRAVKNAEGKQALKPVFLLTGWIGKGGDKSKGEGWKHIRENHGSDFKAAGVESDREIKELVMKAVTEGEVIGSQGSANGRDSARPIYKVGFKTRTHFIAVSTSPDGSIIGANPNDQKYIEAGLRDDVFPSTRHFYEVVEKDRNGPQRMADLIRTAIQKRTSR
ncbi:RHS repeat protein [Pseudomonas guariconensis]|uniref:RHS repeat protein n=1 Tax=Pseudomonas guariconensis TaxID=1288410 RepID=UPI0018ABDAE1|nr:RHS repeat domain-containing protein [Pseudomonas guariconensis]MBF8755571.1 RHS repeat protein [Pseudomonas guariconensis]